MKISFKWPFSNQVYMIQYIPLINNTYIDFCEAFVDLGRGVAAEPRGHDAGWPVTSGLCSCPWLGKSNLIRRLIWTGVSFLQLHIIDGTEDGPEIEWQLYKVFYVWGFSKSLMSWHFQKQSKLLPFIWSKVLQKLRSYDLIEVLWFIFDLKPYQLVVNPSRTNVLLLIGVKAWLSLSKHYLNISNLKSLSINDQNT